MKRMRSVDEIRELAKSSTIEVPREFDADNFIPAYVGDIKHAVCKLTNGKSLPDVDFSDDGVLELLVYDNNFFKQIWHPISDAGLTREYQRSFSATTFKPWRRIDEDSSMIPSKNVEVLTTTTTIGTQEFKAKADGYIALTCHQGGASSSEVILSNNVLQIRETVSNRYWSAFIPVAKDDNIVLLIRNNALTAITLSFIYSK